MDRNSCLNYFQAFPFWEHMTAEDQNFLLDNIRELHYPAGAAVQSEERQCLSPEWSSPCLSAFLSRKRGHSVPFTGQRYLYPLCFLHAFCHYF